MQLPIAGQAYEHPSQDVNNQRCVNLFATSAGPDGRGQATLLPTPGLKELIDLSGNEVRGIIDVDDVLYTVVDNTYYRITVNTDDDTATSTSLGTLDTSSGPVYMARNPTQVMIVDGSTKGYIHTTTSDDFEQISDADFQGGSTVVFLDSYFFYIDPTNNTIHSTGVNDGLSVESLDVTTAEGKPDKSVGLAVDKRELWIFGRNSIEIWYNAANPTGFPLSRQAGAFVDQGCAALGSIINFDNSLMWLDDRGFVVKAKGYTPEIVSTEAINAAIDGYSTISDAVAYKYNDGGHLFYVLTFPTENKTWVYDASTGFWHERAYFDQNDTLGRHISNCYAKHKRLNIVGSYNSGQLFIMSRDYYDDAGDPIHRIRTTSPQDNEFKQMGVSSLELKAETGKAPSTGTGSDPNICLRYSDDNGYTWSNSLERSLGKTGEYNKSIRWNRLGTGREWVFEFSTTEPVKFSLIEASVEINGGIT